MSRATTVTSGGTSRSSSSRPTARSSPGTRPWWYPTIPRSWPTSNGSCPANGVRPTRTLPTVLQFHLEGVEFGAQPVVGVEPGGIDVVAHGTAGLGLMAAVREPALQGPLGDVGERSVEALAVGPEAQRAQTGRVHQQAAAGQAHQLGRGGGVAALLIGPHVPDPLHVSSYEGIDQRRLPHSGGA